MSSFLLSIALAALGGQGFEGQPALPEARLYVREDGAEVRVAVELRIAPGWHVYHGPTQEAVGDPGVAGQPTTVEFEGAEVVWSGLRFPEPERGEQDFGDGPLAVFEHRGVVVIWAHGRKVDASASLAGLRAKVGGQTCSDETGVCVRFDEIVSAEGRGSDPLFAKFPVDLTQGDLTHGASATQPASGAASATGPPEGSAGGSQAAGGTGTGASGGTASGGADAPTPPHGTSSKLGADDGAPARSTSGDEEEAPLGLLEFLLSAVGWAIFTLFMPCTYPMIPITISYFTKQASQRKTSVLPLSLTYGAGIVLIFVVIGVLVGPLIIPFAAHPVTNLVIGGFFLLFALALFGVVDLQPPAALMNVAGQASMKGGYAGVFLMGATLVVTSFTCTAPFVGTLLATGASSGDLGRVALGMGVFGATMAVPFVLLSLVPDRVKAMPRAGEWMHVLKVTLGFVEVAAALKFLSNVDLVWGWGWLSRELFLFLWLGIFLAASAYLFGLVRLKDEASHEIGPRRMVAALGFFLFSIYCGYGAVGNSLDPVMTALAPPYSNRTSVPAIGSAGPGAARKGPVIVKDDYRAALELAKRDKKGLLVNFTGFT